MVDISCSIVLFHTPEEEIKLIVETLLKSPKSIRIYIVDNSTNDSLRFHFNSTKIEYIFTGKNLGYGAAHNIAIKKAIGHSNYHIILNPDIIFNYKALDGLYDFMELNQNVGLVMPKILYKDGKIQYLCKRLPSPADLILRRFSPEPIKHLFKKAFDKYELRFKNYNDIMEVPNLSGCFMFIRTSIFINVGFFDEQYFLYMEDTDLCRRINKYYRTIYYPLETVIHGYSKASYKNLKSTKYHLSSSIKYFNKWGWFADRNRLNINNSISVDSFTSPSNIKLPEPQFF